MKDFLVQAEIFIVLFFGDKEKIYIGAEAIFFPERIFLVLALFPTFT